MYNRSIDVFDFDFGLIRLKKRLWFNKRVRAIRVSQFGDASISNGEKCLTSGWNGTSNSNENAHKLHGIELPIVDHERCSQAYDGLITPRMICAGYFDEDSNNGKLS